MLVCLIGCVPKTSRDETRDLKSLAHERSSFQQHTLPHLLHHAVKSLSSHHHAFPSFLKAGFKMQLCYLLLFSLVVLLCIPSIEAAEEGPFQPTWESLQSGYQVPKWYQDDKFGIFVHWGVYSVPAYRGPNSEYPGEWYPRNMYIQGSEDYEHHRKTYGPQTKFGYKDFIPRFTGANFDPDAWAQLFKDAGARFVVPVAEHHDGFPMYDTNLSDWNAAKMGPKRNIIGELSTAIRKQGMHFGVSSHRAEHWWYYDGGRAFPSDVQREKYESFYGPARPNTTQPDEKFLEDWLARTCELVDKFRPQIVCFDNVFMWLDQPAFAPYLQRFAAYFYNRDKEWGLGGVAIDYKYSALPEGAGVMDFERGQVADIRPLFWQTDTSMSIKSWGFVRDDNYTTSAAIVRNLVDIVSKNGALLLNVGPSPDGTINLAQTQILRDIGRWLAANGAVIYGTRPWRVFGEGPTEVAGGSFQDVDIPFTSEDIRFTVGNGSLLATALSWPESGRLTVRSLSTLLRLYNGTVLAVTYLPDGSPLPFHRDGVGLHVSLPPKPETAVTCSVKIEGDANLDAEERAR